MAITITNPIPIPMPIPKLQRTLPEPCHRLKGVVFWLFLPHPQLIMDA
jgi:hypothetical protein